MYSRSSTTTCVSFMYHYTCTLEYYGPMPNANCRQPVLGGEEYSMTARPLFSRASRELESASHMSH